MIKQIFNNYWIDTNGNVYNSKKELLKTQTYCTGYQYIHIAGHNRLIHKLVASKICNCLKLENSSVVLSRIKEQYNRHGIKLEGVSIRYPLLESSGGRQKTAVVDEKILYDTD